MGHGAHILLFSYPVQGHINPTLQFAKSLIRLGTKVTFLTSISAQKNIGPTQGLTLATFSETPTDGTIIKSSDDYLSFLRSMSSEKIKEIINTSPVTCVVYAHLLPWAGDVARSFGIPFALLWIQPAAGLNIYYQYFNGNFDAIDDTANDPSGFVELPGLPRLASRDLPSFLLPTCAPEYKSFIPLMKEQKLALDAETKATVLVNTFDKLESAALRAIDKYNVVGIGPLIPSAFLDGKDPSDRTFGGDYFQKSLDHVEWLNAKPKSSVIYISFGSMLELPKEQVEEIAYGLLESKRPFLWVVREKGEEKKEEEKYSISCMKELREKGMIVPWCSQLEVLSNPSLGCFITHCGWNSTIESLASGVPMVAFPQWADQPVNAKLIEDVWKTGVRVREGEKKINGKEIVGREEIKRCIEMVMGKGEKNEEFRRNARKWKDLAREAVVDGGTSDTNLKAFLKKVGEGS